jgi:hypothetical protein
MHNPAPENFQVHFAAVDFAGLPPTTDPEFEQADITHYALQYAAIARTFGANTMPDQCQDE